jgi:hypothetical protein
MWRRHSCLDALRLRTPEVEEFAVSPWTAPFGHRSETQNAGTEPRPEGAVGGRETGSSHFPWQLTITGTTSGVRRLLSALFVRGKVAPQECRNRWLTRAAQL